MVRARYDAVADFYISGFDSADDPASLALLDLLGPVAGLRVLDVACGHGRITGELARRGGGVAGIDLSAVLISKASGQRQATRPRGRARGVLQPPAGVFLPTCPGRRF